MKIKDFKIIKKETYNEKVNYIKFKRLFFGFIPMWFYLRQTHLDNMYKYIRYSFHIFLLNFLIIFLNIQIPIERLYQILFIVFHTVSVIYLLWSVVWLYTDGGKIRIGDWNDEQTLIKEAQMTIDRFNNMFDKTKNKTSTVFSTIKEEDKRYYNIKIPRINFKKYIY